MASGSSERFSRHLHNLYEHPPAGVSDLTEGTLRLMFDEFLGGDYDPEKRNQVIAEQRKLREEQRRLADGLRSKRLSPDVYIESVQDLLTTTFGAMRAHSRAGRLLETFRRTSRNGCHYD